MEQTTEEIITEAHEQLDEIAKTCNQLLDNPPDDGYKEAQVLLIRHGFSQYNYNQNRFRAKHGDIHQELAREVRLNVDDIDTHLHPIGIIQAMNSQKYLNDLNVHTVFVSPLLRTLQTAEKLFETHPQQQSIKFIVLPELAEGLCFSCSFAPFSFSEIRKQQFKNFDFSHGDKFTKKPAWQLEQIQCQQTMEQMMEKTKDIHDEDKLSEIFLEELDRLYPAYLETHDHLWLRAQEARKVIEEYKKTIPNEKKIVIVSHYVLSLFMTSSQKLQNFHEMDGVRCKNSKIIPWNI